jgi:NitT/TauT family transport system substrate-binding protein
MHFSITTLLIFLSLSLTAPATALSATVSLRVLYPSFAGSWATAWIAKEAGYFTAEGLDVELIRVGGSSRMVAAMLGGSAPLIQAGAPAALAANLAGSDVVIIAATGTVSPFRLMARPEIRQPADLKGKKPASRPLDRLPTRSCARR